jgi:hypothetical protein
VVLEQPQTRARVYLGIINSRTNSSSNNSSSSHKAQGLEVRLILSFSFIRSQSLFSLRTQGPFFSVFSLLPEIPLSSLLLFLLLILSTLFSFIFLSPVPYSLFPFSLFRFSFFRFSVNLVPLSSIIISFFRLSPISSLFLKCLNPSISIIDYVTALLNPLSQPLSVPPSSKFSISFSDSSLST